MWLPSTGKGWWSWARQLVRLHLELRVSTSGTSWSKSNLDSLEKMQSRAQGWCSIGKSRQRGMEFFPSKTCQEPQRRQTLLRGAERKRTGANKLEQGQSCLGIGGKSFQGGWISPESGCCNQGCRKSISGDPQAFMRKGPVPFGGSLALSRGLSRDLQGSLPICIPP